MHCSMCIVLINLLIFPFLTYVSPIYGEKTSMNVLQIEIVDVESVKSVMWSFLKWILYILDMNYEALWRCKGSLKVVSQHTGLTLSTI